MDTEFENKLKPQLKRVKDIFVFGSTVGLRFSDLMSLKNNSIQYTGEGVFLSINTQKTGAEVRIPLPQYAVDIIEKYKKRGGNYVLPRLAGSNLNIQLKNLMKVAGWVYTLPKFRTRRGVLIEIKTRKGESYRFFFRPESPATRPRIWQGFLAATKNFATISAQTISLQSSN